MLFQVNYFLSEKSIINSHQHDFRQNISTECLLFELYNRNHNTIDGKLAIIISLDLSKAFDTVNHFQLINKLRDIGFSIKDQKLMLSYLRERVVVQMSLNSVRSMPTKNTVRSSSRLNFGSNIIQNWLHFLNCKWRCFSYADDCKIIATFNKNCTFDDITDRVKRTINLAQKWTCLLYTSDAADE